MVTLTPMKQGEYDAIIDEEIQHYAEEKVKAGTWMEDEALPKSKETFASLLPDGLNTDHHQFLSIIREDESVGYFWVNFNPEHKQKNAFIYNFLIFEPMQGKGYGKAALQALEIYAKEQGAEKLSLHVFGHNQRAYNLYQKLQFQVTDINMSKSL
ncbi:GNAT family N-acetyltransferase [Halobacillus salinus]|uniref:GNAT family N-acetyltransferase n=1 Tax=Halobacillus salinus TaxID=192814 RepID=A0A4Z0H2I8_9BACI|nr:GNAT family N-acetyltransferase [Halobacillus salinus]TGB04618.1 GNAT family N-acetyltransferase [Halobacillus salinus]